MINARDLIPGRVLRRAPVPWSLTTEPEINFVPCVIIAVAHVNDGWNITALYHGGPIRALVITQAGLSEWELLY